jgi:penicillin G amidase
MLTPLASGEIVVEGKTGKAQVLCDEEGIWHILAENREMGAYALGYVHAKDRLWHMDSLRRMSQGRLSEVFG